MQKRTYISITLGSSAVHLVEIPSESRVNACGRHMFNFKYRLAFPRVGLQVIWPLKSWVRGFRGRGGASARVWQALPCWDAGCGAGVCRAVHLLPEQGPTFPLPHTHGSEMLWANNPSRVKHLQMLFTYSLTYSLSVEVTCAWVNWKVNWSYYCAQVNWN